MGYLAMLSACRLRNVSGGWINMNVDVDGMTTEWRGGERSTWRASCRVTNLECPGNESRSPHMFVNGVSGHRSGKRVHK